MDIVTSDWQAWLDQGVRYLSHGYTMYHLVQYPLDKKEKWLTIDQKLSRKYRFDVSKSTRYRLRNKGFCCFAIIRWEGWCLILRKPGEPLPGVLEDDKFLCLTGNPIRIEISQHIELEIVRNSSHITVRLSKKCFEKLKRHYLLVLRSKGDGPTVKSFDRLNGLPSFNGIIKNKVQLRDEIIKASKRSGGKSQLKKKNFRIRTRKKVYKFYDKNS